MSHSKGFTIAGEMGKPPRKPYVHAQVDEETKAQLAEIGRKTKRKEADVVRGLLLRGINRWKADGMVYDPEADIPFRKKAAT